MAMTLVQMRAEFPNDPMRMRLVDKFLDGSESVVLPELSFVDATDALGYNFVTDDDGGDVAERSLNDEYAASNPVSSPKTEKLTLFGGSVKTDAVQIDAKGDVARLNQIDRRMKRMGKYFDKVFFHGQEVGTNVQRAKQFAGLRKRSVAKGRVLWAGANGGPLTMDLLDEAQDLLSGENGRKVIFCTRWMRRKITNLLRTAAAGKGIAETNEQQTNYNGSRIKTVTEDDKRSPIFAFDETRGSSNVTQSLYIVRFGGSDDGDDLQAIRGPSFMKQRAPVNMGEYVKDVIDNVMGIVDFSPHCFIRIGGITEA
jgi:hypothetical protein